MSLQLLPRRFTWLFARIAHIGSTRHFKHDAATQVLLGEFLKKQERWGIYPLIPAFDKKPFSRTCISVVADAWGVFVHFGAEVAKEDERHFLDGLHESLYLFFGVELWSLPFAVHTAVNNPPFHSVVHSFVNLHLLLTT